VDELTKLSTWLSTAFQNGWATAGVIALIAAFFFRQWRLAEAAVDQQMLARLDERKIQEDLLRKQLDATRAEEPLLRELSGILEETLRRRKPRNLPPPS
jgi:uncharacterized membrane protein YciS (DUF1049 family)